MHHLRSVDISAAAIFRGAWIRAGQSRTLDGSESEVVLVASHRDQNHFSSVLLIEPNLNLIGALNKVGDVSRVLALHRSLEPISRKARVKTIFARLLRDGAELHPACRLEGGGLLNPPALFVFVGFHVFSVLYAARACTQMASSAG